MTSMKIGFQRSYKSKKVLSTKAMKAKKEMKAMKGQKSMKAAKEPTKATNAKKEMKATKGQKASIVEDKYGGSSDDLDCYENIQFARRIREGKSKLRPLWVDLAMTAARNTALADSSVG